MKTSFFIKLYFAFVSIMLLSINSFAQPSSKGSLDIVDTAVNRPPTPRVAVNKKDGLIYFWNLKYWARIADGRYIDEKTSYPAGVNDYGVSFHTTAFTDSSLVNSLASTTAYFNKGLVLKSSSLSALTNSYLSLWNYGFLASDFYTHRLVFQVLDSSSSISIGIGVRSGQVSVANNQINYITGTIGSSSTTTAGVATNVTGTTSTGVLINKGDFIELTASMVALDSTVLVFRNLTNGTYKKVVRKLTTATSTAVLGYPTIYFAKGHVRLLNYSLSKPDFDYIFFGNSITAGFYASDIDSAFVGQLKKWTASSISNGAMSGACTVDFLKVKEGYNIKNKIVFLSGVFGQDPNYVISAADSKTNYQTIVNKLKANNNRIIHIDNPYRNQASWSQILALNQWMDSTYRGIDTIISIDSLLIYPTDYHDVAHLNNSGNIKIAGKILSSVPYLYERWNLSNIQTILGSPTILSGSASLSFPTFGAGQANTLTITVTGAALGDVVALGVPDGLGDTEAIIYYAWVSSANTVKIKAVNASSGPYSPMASQTFKVKIFK